MALALDSSTPARATASATAVTTVSFTPPAGAILVACTSFSGGAQNGPSTAITNTGGGVGSWTSIGLANANTSGSVDGAASMHWALVNSSVATTVTATQTSGSSPTSLKVYVITGADTTTPVGVNGIGSSTANTLTTTALTTTGNNSYFIASTTEWNTPGGAPTSSDFDINTDLYVTGTSLCGGSGIKSVASPASTTCTVDLPGTATARWSYVTAEILAGSSGITATPTSITTAEAFGNPASTGDITASPGAISSDEAFGTPTATTGGGGVGIALEGTPTLYETASGTSAVIPYPTGIAAGELLLAAVTDSSATAPTTNPGGWTLAKAQAANNTAPSSAVWYKFATGSESGSVTFATNGTAGRVTGSMSRWSGVDATTPEDTAAVSAAAPVQATFDMPSITTVTDDAMLIHAMAMNASALTNEINTLSGTTEFSQSTGTGRCQACFYELRPTAGATGTRTWTKTNSGTTLQWTGITIALRPAGGGGGPATPVLNRCVNDVPGTTTMAIKVNTTNATSVRIKAGTNSALTTGVVFGSAATPDGNGNAEPTITGLTAGTSYFYRIAMTDSGSTESLDDWSTVGEFKTDQNSAMNFTVGFGSCTNSSDSTAVGAIAVKKPDLFLHLGDEYYADGSGTSVANFRDKMNAKKTATNFKAVYRTSGSSVTPSDHDGMNNDGNAGSDATAWTNYNQVFREMNPTTDLPGSTGVYRSFKRGRVRFLRIDRRSFATIPSATDNSSKTCLGTTQKQWFKDEITNATEPLIIVQNESPWISTAAAGDDAWAGYTTERTELANHISASGKRVIFLAGDMHAVAAEDGSGAPGGVTVFHAAPFDNNASQKGGPYDVGPYPASGTAVVQQYGWLAVTDSGGQIQVVFEGFSADNTQRVTMTKTYSLPVTASPTGIGSAEALGTPTANKTLTSSPGGISSAEAFGTAVVALTLSVSPAGIGTAEAFGTPTEISTLTATPSGIASAEVFGTPSTGSVYTASPSGIATAEAFGTPSNLGLLTASPTGISSLEAFGSPTRSGTLTATPAGIASLEALGTPTANAGFVASPTGIGTAEAFGTTTARVPVTATPGGIASGEVFGTPSISYIYTAQPTGIGTAETFGTPTELGSLIATPGGIASAEMVSNATAVLTFTASPTGIPSGQAMGTPATSNILTARPTPANAGETFGTPAAVTPVTATATGIPTAQAMGFPVVSYVSMMLPTGIPSALAFGNPTVTLGPDLSRNLDLELVDLPDTWETAIIAERFTTGDLKRRFSLALIEGEEMQILVSAGASQYVGGTITETGGKDISTAVIKMSLGSETQPGTWVDPTVDVPGPNNVRKVMLLAGAAAGTPKGTYYAWARVTDTPEVVPMRFPQKIIVR